MRRPTFFLPYSQQDQASPYFLSSRPFYIPIIPMDAKSTSSSRFKQLHGESFLSQFLSRHDDPLCSGFITRLDRSPIKAKRLAFAKAFALNVVVLAFLIGFAFVTVVKDLFSTIPVPFRLGLCVTQDLAIMLAILVLLRSTTVPFFWGECRFRFHYGFRASELIIRKPPKGLAFKNHLPEDQRLERYWRMAIHAVNPNLLYSNSNALLSSEYWIVEYSAVFDAMERIAGGDFDEEALEFAVWKQDKGTWSSCELWRMHEIMTDQQEVAMFKTFLTEAGKQELLAIWQDMLLSTSSTMDIIRSPSPKAYQAMVDKFAREGLDYETVWSQVSEKGQTFQ